MIEMSLAAGPFSPGLSVLACDLAAMGASQTAGVAVSVLLIGWAPGTFCYSAGKRKLALTFFYFSAAAGGLLLLCCPDCRNHLLDQLHDDFVSRHGPVQVGEVLRVLTYYGSAGVSAILYGVICCYGIALAIRLVNRRIQQPVAALGSFLAGVWLTALAAVGAQFVDLRGAMRPSPALVVQAQSVPHTPPPEWQKQ